MMVYCSKCGKDNVEEANFCHKCGAAVGVTDFEGSFDEKVDRFAKQMEAFGKEAGKKAEKFGRQVSIEMERMTRGTSVCPSCNSSYPGRHNNGGKCGTEIK